MGFVDGRECKCFGMKEKVRLENACNTKQKKISAGRGEKSCAEEVKGRGAGVVDLI
jgi:hypothetical protein